ncbi:MAG: phage tail tape measure protein [Treponema sp.]
MSKAVGELYAKLALKTDEFEKNAYKSKEIAEKLGRDIDGIVDEINEKLTKIGTVLSVGVTAPLTIFAKQSLETFSSFEQSMQNTFSVMGATESEMEALKKKAEEMGASTRFSASQAADALYNLGSAGQNAGEAMNSLDGVLRLAGATGSDLAFTSGTIASTLSQFNLTADKAAHIADVYATAISKSQANMTKLSYSMKYVGPVASGLNVSLETATAALMRLYNTGFGGEQAGTILRSGLQKLASGTNELKGKLAALGLQYDEVNPKTNSFADIIDRLKAAQVGVTEANDLFGEAAAAGMQKLIEGGGDAIRTMDGLLQASDGAAEKMQEIQNASFANTKAELMSAWEAVQITLTSNVIPAVDTFAQGITGVLKVVNNLPVGIQTTGTALAGIAASAGPLLLVAVGIAKIKREMVQLNVALAANPIALWAAGIAAAGAVAMGIIAQVRKAQEDAYKAAGRQLEEAQKTAEDARKDGEKGRSIQSLLEKYDSLKDKIKDSTEAESEFNRVIEQLKQAIPGAGDALKEHGEGLEAFVEKARKTSRELLEMEKVKNERALLLGKSAADKAQHYVEEHQGGIDQWFKDLQQTTERTDRYKNVLEKMKTAALSDAAAKQEALQALEAIRNDIQKDALDDFAYGTFDGAFETLQVLVQLNTTAIEQESKKLSEASALLEEQKTIVAEAETLKLKIETGEAALAQLDKPEETQTKQQAIDALMKKWEEFKTTGIKAVEERKKIEGEAFDRNKEYYEFLKAEIKKTAELQNIVDENGKRIQLTSKDLAKPIGLRDWYESLSQKKTGTASSDAKKTMQDELETFDKAWRERISKAKEYGKDSVELEKKYLEERKALIDKFVNDVKTAEKKKKENAGLSDVQLLEKAKNTETSKDSGITLADEYTKTARLGLGAFAKYKEQLEDTRRELTRVQEEIQATQRMIESGQDASGTALSDTDKAEAAQYLKDMQDKAAALRLELAGSKVSLSEIENTLKSTEQLGKSEFQLKLINIEAERKRIHEVIDAAVTAGKIADDEAKKRKDKADKQAEQEVKKAAAEKANLYIQGAANIGQTLAGVIAGAIEQGGLDGIAALQAGGQLLNQIGNMVGDPIAKAVLGGISAAVGIVSTILGAVKRRNAEISRKAREEARQFNDEIKRQQEENISHAITLTGEVIKNIAKLTAGKKLNVNTIFDSQALEIEKKLVDEVLGKIKDAKTEAEYTYQQARTRTVNNDRLDPLGWLSYDNYEETYYTTEKANYTVAQVMEKYNEAMRNKDYAAAKQWKDFAQKAIDKGLQDAGINAGNSDPVSAYIGNLDGALGEYVKTRDMKQFKRSLKEQLYEGLVNKAVTNAISARIGQVFDNVEKGNITYEEALREIEKIGKETNGIFDDMNKKFGLSAEKVRREWENIGEAISASLSSALGDAAYNADWGAFKKSFASEMKKAIIQSAMQSAGIKAKVDSLIQGLMADGKVTSEEVNGTINALKPLYDRLEKMMAEVAGTTKALEGGVEIKAKAAGTIIQELSGADRDVLLEAIKNGFKTINQSIDLKDATIQHLAATQIIINAVTFHSHNSTIHIHANETTDLKALISEIVEKSLAG